MSTRSACSSIGPLAVSSYGLVVNLRYSGDSNTAPTAVREWMIKEMYRHGMGGHRIPGYHDMTPERALADKRNAIVIAAAFIPPGARVGQRVDALCQALPQSNTASLAGGTLYQCELRLYGADALNPGGSVNKYVEARGPLFINPAYALETPSTTDGVARSGARTAARPKPNPAKRTSKKAVAGKGRSTVTRAGRAASPGGGRPRPDRRG